MPESRHRTTIEVDVDDRAVRQLGQELERAIDPSHMAAFERSVERSNRAIERLTRATERMTRASSALARATIGGGGPGGGGGVGRPRGPGFIGRTAATALGTALGQGAVGGRGARLAQMAGAPAGGEGFLGGMFNMIPYAGPVLGAAIQGAQQYYGQYIAAQQARYGAFGATGVTPGGLVGGDLRRAGYGPLAQPGILSQMAQQTGRTGSAAGLGDRTGLEGIVGGGARFQRALGVNPAAILRGAEVQGSVDDAPGLMMDTMARVIEMGFRRSGWAQAVEGLSDLIGSMQRQGIQIDARSMLGLYAGLAAARDPQGNQLPGLRGQAGAAFAQTVMQAGQNVAQGNRSFDFLMLQAAGGGRGGSRTLMQARVFGEQHGGEVFYNLLERLQGMGGANTAAGRQQLAYYLSENLGISADLATQLSQLDPEQIQAMRAASAQEGRGRGGVADFLAREEARIAGPAEAVETEAGLEAQRVDVGAIVSRRVQRIQRAEIALVQVFMPRALDLVNAVMDVAERLRAAFQEGGTAAVLAEAAQMMTALASGIATIAGGAVGSIADWAAQELGENDPVTQNLRRMETALGGGVSTPTGTQATPAGGTGARGGRGGGGARQTAPGGVGGGLTALDPWEAARRHAEGLSDALRRIQELQGTVTDGSVEAIA